MNNVIENNKNPLKISNDPFEAIDEISSYLEHIRYSYDRRVSDNDGSLLGYWQTPEYLQGVVDIVLECKRILSTTQAVNYDELKACAVMNFVNVIRGAYEAGFSNNHPTTYDIYRFAQLHVKDNYSVKTENWDDESAKASRNDDHDSMIEELKLLKKQRDDLLKLNIEFADFAKRQGWQHALIDGHFNLKEQYADEPRN